MRRYTIEVTEAQAATISHACEVLARLGIGQFRDAMECLPVEWHKCEGWHDDMDSIGQILKKHMGVDGWNSSLGICNEKVRQREKTAWDLHQTFRHRLAWDRLKDQGKDKPDFYAVFYEQPFKTSDEPLAKIELKNQ